MPILTDTLPRASHLWSLHQPGDFLDCYSVPSTLSPREAATRGLALPRWADALLQLGDTNVIAGAISDRALYDGAIDLSAALKALSSVP